MNYIDIEIIRKSIEDLGLSITVADARQLYIKYQVNKHKDFMLFMSWARNTIRKIPSRFQGYDRLEQVLRIYSVDKEALQNQQEVELFTNFFHDLYTIVAPRFTPKRSEGFKEEYLALLKRYGLTRYAEVTDWDAI